MEKCYETHKKWLHTPMGRASTLINAYNHKDEKQNRGKGDLTTRWVVDNILFKPCAHCGKIGWDIIGCNRINNDLPHTMDNVEPCCKECNDKLQSDNISKTVYQYTLDGELVAVWKSATEAARQLNFSQSNISNYCYGYRKNAYGYIWSFKPL